MKSSRNSIRAMVWGVVVLLYLVTCENQGSQTRRRALLTENILPELQKSLQLKHAPSLGERATAAVVSLMSLLHAALGKTKDRGHILITKQGLPQGSIVTFKANSYLSGKQYSTTPAAKHVFALLKRAGLKSTEGTLHSILLSVQVSELRASNNATWKPYFDRLPRHFARAIR